MPVTRRPPTFAPAFAPTFRSSAPYLEC